MNYLQIQNILELFYWFVICYIHLCTSKVILLFYIIVFQPETLKYAAKEENRTSVC